MRASHRHDTSVRVVLPIVVGVLAAVAFTPLHGCVAVRIPLPDSKPATGGGSPASGHPASPSHKVYFLKGGRLTAVSVSAKGSWNADAAMAALLAGPSNTQRRQGLTSSIPAGTKLLSLTLAPYRVLVDFPRSFAVGDKAGVRARLAEVVCTLAQFPGVDGVVFYIEGKHVSRLAGADLMRPQTPADFTDVVRGH